MPVSELLDVEMPAALSGEQHRRVEPRRQTLQRREGAVGERYDAFGHGLRTLLQLAVAVAASHDDLALVQIEIGARESERLFGTERRLSEKDDERCITSTDLDADGVDLLVKREDGARVRGLTACMTVFPSARHLVSWAGLCPGHDESAGQRRSGRTRKGNRWLRTALIEAATSASGRTRGTYLNAQYLRLRSRRGHAKAIVAVAHSILVSAYHVLERHQSYEELGGDYFTRRVDTAHLTRKLVRQLERLGQTVTLTPATAESG